jgi:hypothetical protein
MRKIRLIVSIPFCFSFHLKQKADNNLPAVLEVESVLIVDAMKKGRTTSLSRSAFLLKIPLSHPFSPQWVK